MIKSLILPVFHSAATAGCCNLPGDLGALLTWYIGAA